MKIEIQYHKKQWEIFNDKSRFKIIAKGRRFGLTRGFANYTIQKMLESKIKVLWVDTIYANIERYVERYFFPTLKGLDKKYWRWRSIKNDLKIIGSVCDFRSADRPENMEGFGYNLIILNEAGIILKNRKLWEESIAPMMLDYKADVLIGGTPKGKKGKVGKHLFYELFSKASEELDRLRRLNPPSAGDENRVEMKNRWRCFQFSSYDNPLLDKEEIKNLENELPPSLRAQEIYGEFVDLENEAIIKRSWWKFFDGDLRKKRNYGIYQSWDTAFKTNQENDYSVCTTWQLCEDGYYLLNLYRERLEFPDLKRKVVQLYEEYSPTLILIEDHASGQSLIQEMKRETRIPIKPIRKDKDKLSYVYAVTPLIEIGKTFLVMNYELRTKSEIIINECEEFPNGEHDDIVDSISQFLNYAKELRSSQLPELVTTKVKRKRFY